MTRDPRWGKSWASDRYDRASMPEGMSDEWWSRNWWKYIPWRVEAARAQASLRILNRQVGKQIDPVLLVLDRGLAWITDLWNRVWRGLMS